MAVRPILKWPDQRLATVCAPVEHEDLGGLLVDMFDTMYAAPGRGLAAPQIGVMKRLFVMDATWKDGAKSPKAVINPRVVWSSDAVASHPEGCLSIPGLMLDIERPAEVVLAYTDRYGDAREEHLTGFAAVCAQHELDHLDGRVKFDRLQPDQRDAAEAQYRALTE